MILSSPYDRDILDLAVPALAGLAAGPLVSLVDTAFVGQLGRIPLGALGVNTSIFSMTFVVFNFLAYGTTPRVGRAVGNDDREEAGRAVVRALVLAMAVGIVALAALQALARPILIVMGASEELMAPALSYLRIRALAGPAVLLITASHGAFRGYQDTRTPMVVTLGFNVVNGGLDPLLIFVFDWGLAGAAAATAVGQWVGALTFLYLLLYAQRDELGIRLRWPAPHTLVPFLKVGRDLFLRTASLVGTMTLATAMAARVGVTAVAAHQVAAQLWTFLALLVDALAVAAQALVSKHLGADDLESAREVANRLVQWGLAVGVGLGLGFWALRPVLPGFFTDDPDTVAALLDVYLFVVVLQPLNGLVFVGDGIYMGAEAFPYLAKAMIGTALAAAVVLLLVNPMGWGLVGVWWGIATLMVGRILTLAAPYVRGTLFAQGTE
ncbi:MATE family multidrug resistance protein [Salinibacter ruber]|uniref:MATE efflux family protein n=3 Tax=Salinibacter ruber TaxID=146919 RepID=Q2S086_SALRD|nr:MATE family efflux transporter [Salinibacter ruber]ABC44699.1 MATE efflux family protein [Salinibacter ruber DSM 13855]MCS3662588.1 MATE family multidrug resistance protein [Salinibacter ruber]MCS3684969.1 MATE family multidrug resistance protein [Salinibacter ruber]MCS3705260.1 MATE family multidrug resistance protein [Salinibacter ruber]MCS3829177.1 MATE family multidrug resistance protein [Salinibacter ruber]